MSSRTSTPSPTLPRRRSRSQAPTSVGVPDEQASGTPRIAPLVGAPQANGSLLTAGRAVHRRVTRPSEPDTMEEAFRALREQQRQDHNALVQLNLLVTEQLNAVDTQRRWNEDNSRRVLVMEGSI